MTQHLLEAIEINKHRLSLYSDLTGKRSRKVSRALIYSESFSLLSAFTLDNIAKFWQKRGVPVMVHEFISMEEIPEFSSSFTDQIGITEQFPKLNTLSIQNDIMKLYLKSEYKKLDIYIEKILMDMQEFSKHYCMIRHILESVRRSNNLAQMHIVKAKELGVLSPKLFCHTLMLSQILIIHSSKFLDKWAHPIQKDGVPIIYQDVPYIAPTPISY